MRTIALAVSYDGTDWAGIQRLVGRPSIQREIENALEEVLRQKTTVAAAGRTDAGVHAFGQMVSLRTDNPIPTRRLGIALNRILHPTVRVRRAYECLDGFHARRSARYRRYWYVLHRAERPDPLRGRFAWQVSGLQGPEPISRALSALRGTHDFTSFCHGGRANCTRTVLRAAVHERGDYLVLDFQADAFLHRMVRLIAGNVVLVGRGQRDVGWIEELLAARDRSLAGKAAPPSGLCLMNVGYPTNVLGITVEQ